MRFDWKDLALWCFCSFYFGLICGPILFLDADLLEWVSIGGGALGITLAVMGYLINSSSHRLQVRSRDEAEFRRVWKSFGRGQLVRMDLMIAADEADGLVRRFQNGEQLRYGHFTLLDFPGTNVDIEDDPLMHRVVDNIWRGFETYVRQGNDPKLRNLPLNATDIENLAQRAASVRDVRETVRTNYLEVILPFFTNRGWEVELDQYGQYRITQEGQLQPKHRQF